MDYLQLLEKIEASKQLIDALKNALFCRPQVNKKKRELTMRVETADYLPVSMIRELKEKLEEYSGYAVNLNLQVKDTDIQQNTLVSYIEYYNVLHDLKLNLVPNILDDAIYLDVDNDCFSDLRRFLFSLGISKPINQGKASIQQFNEPTIIAEQNPYVPESTNFRRSKFSKEDDYLVTPMKNLMASDKKVRCIGKVFSVETISRTSAKTKKPFTIETIILTDFTDAITIKRFDSDRKDPNLSLTLQEGQIIEVFGIVGFDSYENANVFKPHRIVEVADDPFIAVDDYPGQHHIDLHVHTNRSEMDGVSKTGDLIKTAYRLGSKAIAITDTSVVQAFPLAQQAHSAIDAAHPGNDFKVIYGIDVKVVDDILTIVHNPTDQKIKGSEFAVIDFETTGLSTRYDHIIEFGGIIVKNNTVTNIKKQLFVKPPVSIPPFIEKKTNITNEMLGQAQPIEEAIDEILDFIGDRVIVAHNADFDFNFLNDTLVRIGRKPLTNICLDTLNLARLVVNDRKYYRLGVIANYYGVNYDEEVAHRGDYDAEVLADVLVKMLPDIENYENITYRQLQENQPADIYKKAHTYTATLLAKNMAGVKRIYEIVTLSHTKYLTYFAKKNAKKIDMDVQAEPRIPKSEIIARRKDLLIGSANQYSELFEVAMNRSLADLKKCMEFYDYVEINPLANYRNLMESGSAVDGKRVQSVLMEILATADQIGKPVIASSDVFYANPYEKVARDIYISATRIGGGHHPLYQLNKERRKAFRSADQHLMTTQQMLDAFAFTGRASELVIDNPIKIADMIEKLYPIPTKLATPTIEGCEQILHDVVYENAHKRYGDPLPEIVEERIQKELTNIIQNGYSVQYYIAYRLVKNANNDGYPVGSRGSVGSSFIATMADITEVNPLVPHYVCPHCQHSEFFTNNEYANGFDLPEKNCPVCGSGMIRDGHNIPFETFLGFNGDKVPDIDLNFSPEYQGNAQQQVREIFGEEYSYRAGTIGTVAQKTAFGYIKHYCEEMDIPYFNNAYNTVLSMMCEGVKRTTGQHPGGIVVIPKEKEVHDFTPIQYPANNPFSDWLTTHFAFADLHDNILKLDILAHIDPTAIRLLSIFSGIDYKTVPMNDRKALSLFSSTEALNILDYSDYHETTGAAGLPEFGTHNNRRILHKTKPTTFNELVNFEGLTHGTDVWSNNAELLIDNGTATINEVISCRDDIMSYLISKNMNAKMSFDIMEKVRKGKGLKPEWIAEMQKHDVPEWYINSCQLIKYMFPKAHAVAYAMNAVRVAWYKVYRPIAYYAVFFSVRSDAYDIETMLMGESAIREVLRDIQKRMEGFNKVTTKEEALEPVLEIALEMYLRGYHFSPMSLEKSDAVYFLPDPDDEKGIIPSFNCIDGLGEVVARKIVEQRKIQPFISKEDFIKRTGINNTQMAFMERMGVLDQLSNENQLSLF